MKRSVCLLLIVSVLFAGCAGRDPNPVPIYIPGDENRSCDSLRQEVNNLHQDMNVLAPDVNKADTNTLWFIAGVFFLVPFFFMDLKDAEKTEYQAMAKRIDRLEMYMAENCGEESVAIESSPKDDSKNQVDEPIDAQAEEEKYQHSSYKKVI